VIGYIHDFADEGKLVAFFRIVPRVSNSNETERSGAHYQTRQQNQPHRPGAVRLDRTAAYLKARHRQGDHRAGTQYAKTVFAARYRLRWSASNCANWFGVDKTS